MSAAKNPFQDKAVHRARCTMGAAKTTLATLMRDNAVGLAGVTTRLCFVSSRETPLLPLFACAAFPPCFQASASGRVLFLPASACPLAMLFRWYIETICSEPSIDRRQADRLRVRSSIDGALGSI